VLRNLAFCQAFERLQKRPLIMDARARTLSEAKSASVLLSFWAIAKALFDCWNRFS
jgi:hypothetical protein